MAFSEDSNILEEECHFFFRWLPRFSISIFSTAWNRTDGCGMIFGLEFGG